MHRNLGTFFGPATLIELLQHRARFQAEETAFTYLVDGENEEIHLTYEELDRQARAIAAWLQSHDLVGERALLLYPAGTEFIAAFFGCLYAGVVAVPVYPPRRNRSLNRIQAISDAAEAKVALTTDVVLNRVEPLIDETPHLKKLTWLATCHVPDGMEKRWDMPDVKGETLAFLQYTSGSTGTPKGVMLNHLNLIHNSALIAYAFEHTRSGSGVFWLPSYHDMGLIGGILQPLYLGRPNILMSPMSFLQKPFRWLSAISRYGGTTSGGPNFAYDLCVRKIKPEQIETLDLSTWEVAFNGAEPVRAETLDRFAETFAPCGFQREAFYPCYGMAEATLIVSGGFAYEPPVVRTFDTTGLSAGKVVDAEPDDEGVTPLVGCGGNLPDQQIMIADPDSLRTCPPGQVGEIWVRGPSVAAGYWNQKEATEQTFQAYLSDTGDGPFLRTGDLGFMQDGELFVTGRIKDLIIVNGVNYYPQDIELTVHHAHPRLRLDCGATFATEVDGRQVVVAVQEVERRKLGDWDSIFSAIRRAVAAEHELNLDAIVLIKAGSIPKTSSGKIQRHACCDGYLNGTLSVVHHWGVIPESAKAKAEALAEAAAGAPGGNGKPTADVLGEGMATRKRITEAVLEEIHRVAQGRADHLALDEPIAKSGLNSLERMEVLAALEERFAGRFPEEILSELETTHDVAAAVRKYLGSSDYSRATLPPDAEIPAAFYHVEQFPEYVRLQQELESPDGLGLGHTLPAIPQPAASDQTTVDGRQIVDFSTPNYLGMSGDSAVARAAKAAIDHYGTSASASRLVSGQNDLHVELEQAIAQFLGTEDAMVTVGGQVANETVVGHLLGPGDLILHDTVARGHIVQGALLSGARRRMYPHNDWQAADALLGQFRRHYRRVLLVVEGLHGTEGDVADLPRFIELRERHKMMLMVDETHSYGTLGASGRGIGELFGVERQEVDFWEGALSGALGSCGGFVAGSSPQVEYLKYKAAEFGHGAGLAPSAAAAALTALRLLAAEPQRVARLQQRAKLFVETARNAGLDVGHNRIVPIVPVVLGSSARCLELSRAMMRRGFNVAPVLPPIVREGGARLRFFITARHTKKQIQEAVRAMVQELQKIDAAVPDGAACMAPQT